MDLVSGTRFIVGRLKVVEILPAPLVRLKKAVLEYAQGKVLRNSQPLSTKKHT